MTRRPITDTDELHQLNEILRQGLEQYLGQFRGIDDDSLGKKRSSWTRPKRPTSFSVTCARLSDLTKKT
jgi:hypothetical protein